MFFSHQMVRRARLLLVLFTIFVAVGVASVEGGVRRIWAVNDGEKVKRDDRQHPARTGNSAWDGRRVRVFAARNEIVAFQVGRASCRERVCLGV